MPLKYLPPLPFKKITHYAEFFFFSLLVYFAHPYLKLCITVNNFVNDKTSIITPFHNRNNCSSSNLTQFFSVGKMGSCPHFHACLPNPGACFECLKITFKDIKKKKKKKKKNRKKEKLTVI